jgi:alpha-galactosidase
LGISRFEIAAKPIPSGEPLDWMWSICPKMWLLNGEVVEFNRNGQDQIDF